MLLYLIGLPGSGKSTYAKNLSKKYSANIYSSDLLREELYHNIDDQSHNVEVFNELYKRVKNDLVNNKNVIYDATNIAYKRRMNFLKSLKFINCEKKCILIATPFEECIRRNSSRERVVPTHIISNMYKNFYIPQYYEGWDSIEINYNYNNLNFDSNTLFNRLIKFYHDNPHHIFTVGNHCIECQKKILSNSNDNIKNNIILSTAALYHDIGKEFTKSFTNYKGESTNIAHFYNHHLVSAYLSLFYLKDKFNIKDLLEITKYITWHMQPFFMNTEKSKEKFINLVGLDFYNNLLILHDADINSF